MGDSSQHERQGLMTTPGSHEAGQKKRETLEQSAPSWFWRVGLPITLIVIPIPYIVLVGLAIHLNNATQSSFGDNISEVLQIASTLWPISFAAVMGPLLKSIALFCAEKGSTLGSLEFLLTSQTVGATLKNLFTIGAFRLWFVGIVAIWCLSPLGGQAAVRSLQVQANSQTGDIPVLYYPGAKMSDLNLLYKEGGDIGVFSGPSATQSLLHDMRNIIATSFYRPDILVSHANGSSHNFDDSVQIVGGNWQASRLGERDSWQNVRIPFMELLPEYNPKNFVAWISVPSDMVVPYASLTGIPIRSGSSNGIRNATMKVQSHYQTLSCSSEFIGEDWVKTGSTKLYFHNTSAGAEVLQHQGGTGSTGLFPNIWFDITNNTAAKEHLGNFSYPETEPSSKLELVVGGNCPEGTRLRTCTINTSYTDIKIKCTRSSASDDLACRADQVRRTPEPLVAGNMTALSSSRTASGVLYEMAFSTASYHRENPSILEKYLKDPTSTYRPVTLNPGYSACFSNISTAVFEARLATALNTVIMAMYNSTVITGGDGTSIKDRNLLWHNGTGTWSEFTKSTYVIKSLWFLIFALSTLLLFICTVANIVIRQFIKAPDFLDSITGLTRDSPFLDTPWEGSGMSGSDRLHMLKDTNIRICDVKPDMSIGRIALTTETKSPGLDWRRMYE